MKCSKTMERVNQCITEVFAAVLASSYKFGMLSRYERIQVYPFITRSH